MANVIKICLYSPLTFILPQHSMAFSQRPPTQWITWRKLYQELTRLFRLTRLSAITSSAKCSSLSQCSSYANISSGTPLKLITTVETPWPSFDFEQFHTHSDRSEFVGVARGSVRTQMKALHRYNLWIELLLFGALLAPTIPSRL